MVSPKTTNSQSEDVGDDATFSRRGLGKRLLLGASALAVLLAAGKHEEAQAAPTTPWVLGGNSGVLTNGTEFLGTRTVAPLIFKTATTTNAPLERMRITPTGNVGIGMTTPSAKLQVYSTTYAIYARHTAASGSHPGVQGETVATVAAASGVLGKVMATAPGANSAGVLGQNNGTNGNGAGVRGTHAGTGYGVHGTSGGFESIGVYGENPSTNRGFGVMGMQYKRSAWSPGASGVWGDSADRIGVSGTSDSGPGVSGTSSQGVGVTGWSSGSHAVSGSIPSFASSAATSAGVFGSSAASGGNGVIGEANTGGSAYAIWGRSTEGYAGVFHGKVLVSGTLSKPAGSFMIDHPLDPENKNLYHSFVESPDMMNVYNGNVTTDAKGDATVEMPDWFEVLNRDFRYQLTVIGQFAQAVIADKMKGNTFTIKTDKPNVEVSWQVTGIRQDAYANANRIPVEEDKPAEQRGKYLHPKEHGKPESAGVDAERVKKLHEHNPKRWAESQGPQRTPQPNQ